MDFLDPKKEHRNHLLLLVGYGLVAIAIGGATLVLLYKAYGYNLDKKGQITQNGLVYLSSQPKGSAVTLNGKPYSSTTNTRMFIPAGSYDVTISANGYRDWQRKITVDGGDVQRFDYPFLFPSKLDSSSLQSLDAAPSVVTQSPDKRWLLVGQASKAGTFAQWDLKDPTKPVQTNLILPDSSYTNVTGTQSWMLVGWAADNRNALLRHDYLVNQVATHEYVLVNRDTPTDSINLTKKLNLSTGEALSLLNQKPTQFYAFDNAAGTLRTLSSDNSLTPLRLEHVVAFKGYGPNDILYATSTPPTGKANSNEVSIVLQQGQNTLQLLSLPAGATTYSLNLAEYSGDLYVAVAADTDNSVYIYKNPKPQTSTDPSTSTEPIPIRRLKLAHPNYISFSDNTQFIMAESGQNFVVYDAENIAIYRYTSSAPLDQPQAHASWMDGDRLLYVSGGKLTVFDYDDRNVQQLQTADAGYLPWFAPDYSYVYSLAPATINTKAALDSTPLTTTKQ